MEHISVTIPPFKYQEKVRDFVCGDIVTDVKLNDNVRIRVASKGRAILYIDPGLGKSRTAIMIAQKLLTDDERIIVVCKQNSINTWRREFTKWVPGFTEDDMTLVIGQKNKRRKLWQKKSRVMVVTWNILHNDYSDPQCSINLREFSMMIGDEVQKLRNKKTLLYKAYRKYVKEVKYLLVLSGTLMRVGPQDLWTSLNLCDHKKFPSYWKFVNNYCEMVEGFYGMEYIQPKNTKALALNIAPHIVRLKESDDEVDSQRPPKTRDYLPIEMTAEQKKLYTTLDELGAVMTKGGKLIITPDTMTNILRLRQALVCPKILDPKYGYGAAIEHMISTLEDDAHQVIFTPFKTAVTYINDAIMAAGYPKPYNLMGGTGPTELRRIEEEFNDPKNINRACVVTIKFAESFELPSAKQARFIGWEWTVDENIQAEDRLHRLTTPHPINIWYYKYDNTIEGSLLQQALDTKANNTRFTLRDYVNTLKGGEYDYTDER